MSGDSGGSNYYSAPKGILVAIGGNEDKEQDLKVLRRIVGLVEGKKPMVEVITTASSIPEELGATYLRVFEKIGVTSVRLMHIQTREEAKNPEYLERIKKADIIFLTGGDQLKITGILGGSPLLNEAVRRYYEDGCIIAGTSAGAAAMPTTMIYGGESEEAMTKGAVNMTGGVGLVKNVIFDSHFIKRGRFSRLMEVVTASPGYLGVGLGEDAGVIVRGGTMLEAIGNGLVVLFDGQNIKYTNMYDIEDDEAIAVENVIVHTLVRGHGYDIINRCYLKRSDFQPMVSPDADS